MTDRSETARLLFATGIDARAPAGISPAVDSSGQSPESSVREDDLAGWVWSLDSARPGAGVIMVVITMAAQRRLLEILACDGALAATSPAERAGEALL